MGGSGGGGAFVHRSPSELQELVRRQEDKASNAVFATELSKLLGNLLGVFNDRDTDAVRDRLEGLRDTLQASIEGPFDHIYGGSVAKHTFINGMSDIDSLFLINDSELEGQAPEHVLNEMERVLVRTLSKVADVSRGNMAVTVEYFDGTIIQLLPAIRTKDGRLQVPSSRGENRWSKIDPPSFQAALTRRNVECARRLVPTIKLAKAIIGQLPVTQRLGGYHTEALAIAAFRIYEGEKTTSAMLPFFFEKARDLVLHPIRDSTGQSVYVDDYLGKAESQERRAVSHILGRIARRIRNATAARSYAQWRALFGIEP